jgi:hypothetical protein
MPVNQVNPPFPTFNDQDGYPLNGGYLYIGQPGFEAQSTPKASFFDVALTIPTGSASGAAVRINGGYAVYNGTPSLIYAEGAYSLSVKDQNDVLIFSTLNYDPTAAQAGGIATIAALRALTPTVGATAFLTESGLAVWYVFRAGDYSAQVTADPQGYEVVKADTIAAATAAWVAVRDNVDLEKKVSFMEILRRTRSTAVIDQIKAGTFSGDLAVEWQAFRDALDAVRIAGGRPSGVIEECVVRTSVSPNFAMDFLRLEAIGNVRVHGISGNIGMVFDGTGLGVGGFGVRHLEIDPIEASSTTGTVGYDIAECHQSKFIRPSSIGGSFAGIRFRGCVTTTLDTPTVSPQAVAWLNANRPSVAIYVSSIAAHPCSWSTLLNPIAEYGINACLQLDQTYGMTVVGGTAEGGITGTGHGLVVGAASRWGKYIGIDCEANTGIDIYCFGPNNSFISCDSQDIIKFEGAMAFGNKVIGGKHWLISMDADTRGNLVKGADANTITDLSTGLSANRFEDCTRRTTQEEDATFPGWHSEWKSYTPTFAATTGAITTATATGQYQVRGGTVDFIASLAITNNGTGSGGITLTLPFVSLADAALQGREIQATGSALVATVAAGSSTMTIHIPPLTYPGAAGRTLLMQGSFRAV